jgi:hypothetical protein
MRGNGTNFDYQLVPFFQILGELEHDISERSGGCVPSWKEGVENLVPHLVRISHHFCHFFQNNLSLIRVDILLRALYLGKRTLYVLIYEGMN